MKKIDPARYTHITDVAKEASEIGLAPKIHEVDTTKQQIVMDYKPHQKWPAYEEYPEPYRATMKALAHFHQTMKHKCQVCTPQDDPMSGYPQTLIHGNLTQKTVLLTPYPIFVNFEASTIGNPYNDIVTFTAHLAPSERQSLFTEYLGHAPTTEERSLFDVVNLSFQSAHTSNAIP